MLKETPSAGSYTRSTVVSGLSGTGAVAVDGSGNLYISCSAGVVKEALAQGTYTQSGQPFGTPFPNSIAVDGTGNVCLTDSTTYNVYKETPTPSIRPERRCDRFTSNIRTVGGSC